MVQLPAMNTTQFGFVKSRLPRKAKPMGEIYQPEVAARAIVYAADHNRREIFVAPSTVKAIVGNKIAPWYADRNLAKNGYDGQMTDEPEDPNKKDNLWEPIPGDHGAHGPFTRKAHKFSAQTWATTHPRFIAIALVSAIFAGVVGILNLKKIQMP